MAPVLETPHHEPREATQRLPVRTISKARGQVKRKETAELIRALRKTGRAGLDTQPVPNGTHSRRRPGLDSPPSGGGGLRRKRNSPPEGEGPRAPSPLRRSHVSSEGGSEDYRMRLLVALLLLSVAAAGKTPSPAHPTLSLRSPRPHLGGSSPELAASLPDPTLWPSPTFSLGHRRWALPALRSQAPFSSPGLFFRGLTVFSVACS